MHVTRRRFLQGVSMAGAGIRVGLPPLAAWFTSNGTAYAATSKPIASRFVFWFNGNGIPERYWIPSEVGADYEMTPCLAPLSRCAMTFTSSAASTMRAPVSGPGNGHHNSMSGVMSGAAYTGRGAGGASIDQVIAAGMAGKTRFRSLQIGVCQESFGESMQRNMSWAGPDRALPPEMIPHSLFDRLFGVRDESWVNRKKSILDAVRDDLGELQTTLGQTDRVRLDEHLTRCAIWSAPSPACRPTTARTSESPRTWRPEGLAAHREAPERSPGARARVGPDARRVLHADQVPEPRAVPWLGYTRLRHHDYTHSNAASPESQRIMRDICRWHVEEFAYLLGKLKSVPEGDGNLLDNTCVLFAHEHAEANPHKNNGLAMILAGHAGGMKTGMHSRMRNTNGDVYLTVAEEIFKQKLGKGFPSAETKVTGVV